MLSDVTVIVRHASAWAQQKQRRLDVDLLQECLDLRNRYDERGDVDWPTGSAERLLLELWPAYGRSLPDPGDLQQTLDSYWMFLRATGRLTRMSAPPADLRKEVKRALPRMAEAYADPARHSQGRVLGDFGRSLGIELDGAADLEDMQDRLGRITAAWNELPVEERRRLMPNPSPKGQAAQDRMQQALDVGSRDVDSTDESLEIEPGDLAIAASQARESEFVRACLALAGWVGTGRELTSRGLLRPRVAREAYDLLHLADWDIARQDVRRRTAGESELADAPEVREVLARSFRDSWRSAGGCLALERLWYPCEAVGLVRLRPGKVEWADRVPRTDQEWCDLAVHLMAAMCQRVGDYELQPLLGVLLLAVQGNGAVTMELLRSWWGSQMPHSLRSALGDDWWHERLDGALHHLDDCNIWTRDETFLRLTDLGRDFTITFCDLVDAGVIDVEL